jgi:hypothetical protein
VKEPWQWDGFQTCPMLGFFQRTSCIYGCWGRRGPGSSKKFVCQVGGGGRYESSENCRVRGEGEGFKKW